MKIVDKNVLEQVGILLDEALRKHQNNLSVRIFWLNLIFTRKDFRLFKEEYQKTYYI
jgi:hypothetical protein